jgi:hypothetical protein
LTNNSILHLIKIFGCNFDCIKKRDRFRASEMINLAGFEKPISIG